MLNIFSIWPIYGTYVSGCLTLLKTLLILGNVPLCKFHLSRIKKVDVSLPQPPLQLEHRQVTWHQQSFTPTGDFSSEVSCVRNNLWLKCPFYWREWWRRLSAFSRSCDCKAKYKRNPFWQQEQLKPRWVAGSLAKPSIPNAVATVAIISPKTNSMAWFRSFSRTLAPSLLFYIRIMLNLFDQFGKNWYFNNFKSCNPWTRCISSI